MAQPNWSSALELGTRLQSNKNSPFSWLVLCVYMLFPLESCKPEVLPSCLMTNNDFLENEAFELNLS